MTRVMATLAAVVCVTANGGGAASTDVFPIFPQAGIVWKDLYPTNFVDLDPSTGLRDYACGTHTYDGHTGTDTIVRSFREMDIGVPVFAALDGEVILVQDGFFDREHGPTISRFDNHIVVQHGPGRFTIYGHLRKGITLRRGNTVVAGQQIGWTASSGSSTWPHLHFTSKIADAVVDPFAGECRPGESGWTEQAPWPTEPYARDLAISAKPFRGRSLLPWDEAERTGTFVRGTRRIFLRLELGAMSPTHAVEVRLLRPDGSVAVADAWSLPPSPQGLGEAYRSYRVNFSTPGKWRLEVWHAKIVGKAPIRVVATRDLVRNRPPNRIPAVTLLPTDPPQCRLQTSLVAEDPDTDIVSYRYVWTVDGRRVRDVTSAALSDVLRRGLAGAGSRVACTVTPSDGRLPGPSATASVTSR